MTMTETIATLKHMMTRCGTDDLSTTIRHGRENEALEAGIDALLNTPRWHQYKRTDCPPEDGWYITITKDGFPEMLWYREYADKGYEWEDDSACYYDVALWMEIPEVPKNLRRKEWN